MTNNSGNLAREFTEFRTRFLPGVGTLVEVPPGLDWVHPGIAVKKTEKIGLGLVALDPIAQGQTVIFFGGKLMTWAEITRLPEDMWDIPYQVSDDIFFGIPKREEIGIGEKINHSCDPNAGFTSEMRLVAIRDIRPGEDVTMDYGTCSSMDGYYLECRCGHANCRSEVTGEDWKNLDLQRRLGNYFQPYLKEKIREQASAEGPRILSWLRQTQPNYRLKKVGSA